MNFEFSIMKELWDLAQENLVNVQGEITRSFQCNIITQHAYNLMYLIHHVACNVNNYFGLTCIKLPWENVNIRNMRRPQYPFVAPRSNTGLYKITNPNKVFSLLISIGNLRLPTLAGTDLLCMLNWGTQWTMVSYLKK